MKASSQQLADGIAGLAIVVFGAWFLWQANGLRAGPGYAAVGPKTFPIIVGLVFLGSGLGVLLGLVREARREVPHTEAGGPDSAVVEGAEGVGTDWPTLLGVAGLLAAYIALYKPLGFILASIVLLPVGARVLGSRAPLRDVIVGVALSLAIYVVFTRLLGLELPAGPLEALL